jgi:hypothetical protein
LLTIKNERKEISNLLILDLSSLLMSLDRLADIDLVNRLLNSLFFND